MSMTRTIQRNIARERMQAEGLKHLNKAQNIKYDKDTVVFNRRGKHSRPILKRSLFALNWRKAFQTTVKRKGGKRK